MTYKYVLTLLTSILTVDCNVIGQNCSLPQRSSPPSGFIWKLQACPSTVIFEPRFLCYIPIDGLCRQDRGSRRMSYETIKK